MYLYIKGKRIAYISPESLAALNAGVTICANIFNEDATAVVDSAMVQPLHPGFGVMTGKNGCDMSLAINTLIHA